MGHRVLRLNTTQNREPYVLPSLQCPKYLVRSITAFGLTPTHLTTCLTAIIQCLILLQAIVTGSTPRRMEFEADSRS